ncbi:MAG: SgcJ/EcaC family oxidoreductase [Gammaproteobacteria bacterium]|nr:SgcJ/EcaC family oxidoreductase [Gammaproteobacteria bacterium]
MKPQQWMTTALLLATVEATSAGAGSTVAHTTTDFESAFNAGDAGRIADLYTEDAIVVSPSQEIVKARPEIREFWAGKIDSGTSSFRVHPINLREDGDSAYQTAVWNATVTSNGRPSEFYGEMTSVFARQPDGSWKIQVQNWY